MRLRRFVLFVLAISSFALTACGSSTKTVTIHTPRSVPWLDPCKADELRSNEGECIPLSLVKAPGGKGKLEKAGVHPTGGAPGAPVPEGQPLMTEPPSLFFPTLVHIPTIDANGLHLIEQFEGYSRCAYWDPYGGVWTAGYGQTHGVYRGFCFADQAAAQANLANSVRQNYEWAVRAIGYPFNQNEVDALDSFAYNLGPYIFVGSLRADLRAGHIYAASRIMLSYVHAGHVTLAGLVTRRRLEVARLLTAAPRPKTPAEIHAERRKRLNADYAKRRALRSTIHRYNCSHGYRRFTREHKRKCTVWRTHGAQVNRDIKRLEGLLGIHHAKLTAPSNPAANCTHPRLDGIHEMGSCIAKHFGISAPLGGSFGSRGIDISVYQGHPSFCYARSHGLRFVWQQSNDGGHADSNFISNTREAHSCHVATGTYIFVEAGNPIGQAYLAVREMRAAGISQDLPVALDVEVHGSYYNVPAMASYLRARGYGVVTYTAPGLWPDASCAGTELWAAEWGTHGYRFSCFARLIAQQTCGTCYLAGVSGQVDLDVAFSLHISSSETPAQHIARLHRELAGHEVILTDLRKRIVVLRREMRDKGCYRRIKSHERVGPRCKRWKREGDEDHVRGLREDAFVTKLKHELHTR